MNINNRFKTTSFDKIEIEEIEWLWKPYFPLGTISFIAGDPGVGKTFITTFISSIISNGEFFPNTDTPPPTGNVIIQNGEDLKGATIKQRLNTFGADNEKIHIIELKDENDKKGDLLLKDIEELDSIFNELKPKLVIFDPITTFLGGVDMNSATSVRSTLRPINNLAEKYNCAIIFVIHRNKGISGGNQLHRLLGSVDFGGIARSVVSVGINPNDKSEKLFIHTKHNLSEQGYTLAFNTNSENGITWLGTRDYLQDDESSNNDIEQQSSPRDKARKLILEQLSENDYIDFESINKTARAFEISDRTLLRAREDLHNEDIIAKKYDNGKVVWYLSDNLPNDHL